MRRAINIRTLLSILAVFAIGFALVASGETDTGTSSTSSSESSGSSDVDTADVEESEPEMTVSQENAVQAAEGYLEMGGFSKKGLIGQLSSSSGEGFPKKDAKFAVRYLSPNWNKQAVKSAEGYMEMGGFSCQGLVEQLSSSAGEGFTSKQARYAAKKVGIC